MIPLQVNDSYAKIHFDKIRTKLLHHIERILNNGGIKKQPKNAANYTIRYSPELENDLNNFLNDPDTFLYPLITQTPDQLIDLIMEWHNTVSSYIDETSPDYKILGNIFVSSVYENDFDKWEFINRINVDTCSYCNRNYIFTTPKNKRIKPEIDHFYPKKKYPMLGLSYYNLIPSCECCNGFGAKGQKDPFSENMVNPYLLNIDDFIFSHQVNNIAIINPLVGKSDITVFFKKKIQSHCDIFNLDDIYSLHHDHAIELVIKQRLKYSKNYNNYLNSYTGLNFSKSEIDRMILGNYALQKDQHKRPLSKLYQDLGKELGLIK
ncbi:HNH endonuclease [Flavobacterium sp. ZS1P14]|uniref:HNH endonuclease n=1 Tax=Flavobacterium sp. ZS1P14 TaxID=3401729 RepID=UPI003AABA028